MNERIPGSHNYHEESSKGDLGITGVYFDWGSGKVSLRWWYLIWDLKNKKEPITQWSKPRGAKAGASAQMVPASGRGRNKAFVLGA